MLANTSFSTASGLDGFSGLLARNAAAGCPGMYNFLILQSTSLFILSTHCASMRIITIHLILHSSANLKFLQLQFRVATSNFKAAAATTIHHPTSMIFTTTILTPLYPLIFILLTIPCSCLGFNCNCLPRHLLVYGRWSTNRCPCYSGCHHNPLNCPWCRDPNRYACFIINFFPCFQLTSPL